MKHFIISGFLLAGILASCGGAEESENTDATNENIDSIVYTPLETGQIEKFAEKLIAKINKPNN